MTVAIITARGGSKRIPRKNIKPFLGIPIIARTIKTALDAGCFDRVIVSTDDEEIADISRAAGAESPFVRPPELSDDLTPTLPVVAHALSWLQNRGVKTDYACCLYPTAPLLKPSDVREGFELLRAGDPDYVITCCAYDFPVQRAVLIDPSGFLAPEFPEYISHRSQDLKPLYHDAGQMYWGRSEAFRAMRPFFGGRALPLLLPKDRVQDIDSEEDWARAEFLYRWTHSQSDDE